MEACLARLAAREQDAAGDGLVRSRAAPAARRGRPDRAAARAADRGEGRARHRRHADRIRLADLARPPAACRCRRGRLGARRRRGGDRQDGDDRVRGALARARPPTRIIPATRPADRAAAPPPASRPAASRSPSAPRPAGSVIRPAAFCGIVGFKPSYGLINRAGLKVMSDTLDTIGVMARSVADCALLAGAVGRLRSRRSRRRGPGARHGSASAARRAGRRPRRKRSRCSSAWRRRSPAPGRRSRSASCPLPSMR